MNFYLSCPKLLWKSSVFLWVASKTVSSQTVNLLAHKTQKSWDDCSFSHGWLQNATIIFRAWILPVSFIWVSKKRHDICSTLRLSLQRETDLFFPLCWWFCKFVWLDLLRPAWTNHSKQQYSGALIGLDLKHMITLEVRWGGVLCRTMNREWGNHGFSLEKPMLLLWRHTISRPSTPFFLFFSLPVSPFVMHACIGPDFKGLWISRSSFHKNVSSAQLKSEFTIVPVKMDLDLSPAQNPWGLGPVVCIFNKLFR